MQFIPLIKKPKKIILPPPPKINWVTCCTGVTIMRGNFSQSDLKFPTKSRNRQGSANAIVAIGYSILKPAETWKPTDLDEILHIGDQLYRTTCVKNKFRLGTLFPPSCIHPTFYAGYSEVNIYVDRNSISGDLFKNSVDSLRNLQRNIKCLSAKFMGVILVFGCNFLALWKQNLRYFCFSSDDLELSNSSFKTNSFILRGSGFESMLKLISKSLSGKYLIYGLKLAKTRKIDDALPVTIDKKITHSTSLCSVRVDDRDARNRAKDVLSKSKSNESRVSKDSQKDLAFSSDYVQISPDRGILCGPNYCADLEKIVHTNIAAAIILYHSRSYMWTMNTIDVILKLGQRIYNSCKEKNLMQRSDWQATVFTPIAFRDVYFNITFRYTVYGTIAASDNSNTDFSVGLKFFFKGNDVGIVMGPQMVLIWQERGVYYMFDPKERDGLGRKWTKALSREIGGSVYAGAACVSWFKDTDHLAELYISNIRDKYHQDGFRISAVKLTPVLNNVKSK